MLYEQTFKGAAPHNLPQAFSLQLEVLLLPFQVFLVKPAMHSLLLVVSFAASCLAQKFTFPQNIELDLIFPRNHTVYTPSSNFPIVFAIQNPAPGWPYSLALDWDVSGNKPVGDMYRWTEELFNSSYKPLPPPGPLLIIGSTSYTNVTDQFTLEWSFTISNASTDPFNNPYNEPKGNHSITITGGSVYFQIATGGIAPEVVVDGKCPQGVNMLVLESLSTTAAGTYPVVNPTLYNTTWNPNDEDVDPKIGLLYTPPPFNPCPVKADNALISSVSAVLASKTALPSATED